MKLDKKIKEKVIEIIDDKVIEEKVNESRDMILNYKDGINPKDEVTKKEIKKLLKDNKKKVEKKENFFVVLLKKFQLRKYRKRNKKLLTHRTKKDNRIIKEAEYRKEIKESNKNIGVSYER